MKRSQRGDRDAFLELYERHAPAAWRLAVVIGHDTTLAAGAVVDASVRVLGRADRPGLDRFAPVDVQMLTAARAAALDAEHLPALARKVEKRMPELSIFGTRLQRDDDSVAAFDQLPELWRSALWLGDVERLPATRVAAVLGITQPNAVKLAERAQGGLRELLAQAQARSATAPGCQPTATRLSTYAAGKLGDRDTRRVRRHLDRCEECRARLDALDDLAPRLHRSVPALPFTLQDIVEEAWLAHNRSGSGPLGLRLPNGAPAPAWAERTLAGATAAIVALGITAAVALGARRGDDPVSRELASDEPVGAALGESAVIGELPGEGGTDGGSTSGTANPDPATREGDATGGEATSSSSSSGAPGAAPRSAPTASSDPSVPSDPTSPEPSSPPTTTPPSEDPVDEVVDTVTGVADSTDLCTGVDTLDGVTGCDSTSATATLPGL